MVRCLSCGKTSPYTDADNWRQFQECYRCARDNHPEFYENKPDHGTGDSKLNTKVYEDLIVNKM